MEIQPVILSGGSGSRLWPLSREYFPKQLLALVEDQTLIQATVTRLNNFETVHKQQVLDPLVVCNENHRFLVAEQLLAIGRDVLKILLEPEGKNTAPALTLAALTVKKMRQGSDPILLVMPADQMIKDIAAFQKAVAEGARLAHSGQVVTFGVMPTGPVTGYGYIRKSSERLDAGAFKVERFVEKPDLETAKRYTASDEYLWNSGLFMMKASVWLELLNRHAAEMAAICQEAFNSGSDDADFYRVDKNQFAACPSNSIDYAVMEKITDKSDIQAVVIPVSMGWSDIGAWATLRQVLPQDDDGNVLKGDVFSYDTKRSLVLADHRMVAAVGVEDVTVVETSDAVLVVHNQYAEQVKNIVEELKHRERPEYLMHKVVYRPWGSYEGIGLGERYQVKRLTVKPGESLSLQMHMHRAEHWIVVKGTAEVTCDDKVFMLSENESAYIPLGKKHRLSNPGKVMLEIIEVQSGSYLGEDDIVRYDDVYGRTGE